MKAYELIEILQKVDPETKLFLDKEYDEGGCLGDIIPVGQVCKVIADINENHKFLPSRISMEVYGWKDSGMAGAPAPILRDGQEKVIILRV